MSCICKLFKCMVDKRPGTNVAIPPPLTDSFLYTPLSSESPLGLCTCCSVPVEQIALHSCIKKNHINAVFFMVHVPFKGNVGHIFFTDWFPFFLQGNQLRQRHSGRFGLGQRELLWCCGFGWRFLQLILIGHRNGETIHEIVNLRAPSNG